LIVRLNSPEIAISKKTKLRLKNRAALVLAALALGGCGRTLFVTGRTNGVTGQTTVTPILGHPSGEVTLALGAKTFAGRWVYVSGPGSVSVVSTTAFNGAHTGGSSTRCLATPSIPSSASTTV
jgi:hypothetical protein